MVPAELRKWVMGGGRKLPGLVLRREAEIALVSAALLPVRDVVEFVLCDKHVIHHVA